jgi:hypothetical protein
MRTITKHAVVTATFITQPYYAAKRKALKIQREYNERMANLEHELEWQQAFQEAAEIDEVADHA